MSLVASTAPSGPQSALLEFFETEFVLWHPNAEANRYRRAIGLLSDMLGRQSQLTDLNRAAIARLRAHLVGLPRSTRDNLYSCLTRIWKLAAALKLLDTFDPPHNFPHRSLPLPSFRRRQAVAAPPTACGLASPPTPPDPAAATRPAVPLRELFERQFLPDQASVSANYATQFRRAIALVGEMLDREPTTADLTAENLADFRELLALAGYSQKRGSTLLCRLRTLWRYADRQGVAASFTAAKRLYFPAPALPPAAAGTLREFFESTYRPQRLLGRTAQNTGANRNALRVLQEHFGRDVLLSELNDQLAADHLAWLLETGRSPVSVNRHRRLLFAIWKLAHQRGLVDRLPSVPALRFDRDPPDAWTLDEAQRIITAAKHFRPGFFISGIAAGDYWHALLLIGYWTALRKRALFAIRTSDLNLETGTLFVPGKSMKTGRGKRYKIGLDAVAAARAIQQPSRELLFRFPFDPGTATKHFAEILQTAGVQPPTRSLSFFHKWRRTTATHVARTSGLAAACALLGHSADYVTRLYVDESQLPDNDVTGFLPSLSIDQETGKPFAKSTVLEEAAELLSRGHNAAAAAIARVALENLLRHACELSGGIPRYGGQTKIALMRALLRRKLIDQAGFKVLRDLNETGNRGAHGRPVQLQQVSEMIDSLKTLYSSNLGKGI